MGRDCQSDSHLPGGGQTAALQVRCRWRVRGDGCAADGGCVGAGALPVAGALPMAGAMGRVRCRWRGGVGVFEMGVDFFMAAV